MKTNTHKIVGATLIIASLLLGLAAIHTERRFLAQRATVDSATAFIDEKNGCDATGIVGHRDLPFATVGALLKHSEAKYCFIVGDENEGEHAAAMDNAVWKNAHPWFTQSHLHLTIYLALCGIVFGCFTVCRKQAT